jgi:hypothetical protein
LRETVYQVSPSEYLLFTPYPYTTRVTCVNGTHSALFLSQTSRIQISEGCSAQLKSHYISSPQNFRLSSPPIVYEWNWDPLSLPADLLNQAAYIDHALDKVADSVAALNRNSNLYHNQTFTNQMAIHNLTHDAVLDHELSHLLVHELKSSSPFSFIIWSLCALSLLTLILFLSWYWYPTLATWLSCLRPASTTIQTPDNQFELNPTLAFTVDT